MIEGLGAFSSAFAARWVADAPGERHRLREGSLVSADLSGFTALTEQLAGEGREGSERLTNTINACFTVLIDAAGREGGDVLKFGGDALLIWFEGEDHEERAARACVRMQRAIAAPRFARADLRMSVGAHADAFHFFLVGRPDWRELVLVGRAVSTTVDLEAEAHAGEVLVSAALARALPPEWVGPQRRGGRLLDLAEVRLPRRVTSPIDPPSPQTALLPPGLLADLEALATTGGEHRMASIVFADLNGTDDTVESTSIEQLTDSVEGLVTAAQEASERFGVQFLNTDVMSNGIKLICTAGAPSTSDDDEESALRFATTFVANDPLTKLRAGVNRGWVFAGFLGSPSRRSYTVMGDCVNLAARLMTKARPGEVVATNEILRRSRAEFATTDLPPFLVKGKAELIEAALVGTPTGQTRGRAAPSLPLVGREHELGVLRRAIGQAVDGQGQVVELVGDAGIGKTRLVQTVTEDPRFLIRIETECQPYDALSPYASIRPLLRRALSIDVDADAVVAGQTLTATVHRRAPHLAPFLPLLAVPLGAQVSPTAEVEAVSAEFRADMAHRLTVELLQAVLTAPALVVVEDVYYIDDTSLALLQRLARGVQSRPWFVIVTRRPEGPGLVVGPTDGTLLKLPPLEPERVSDLAEVALGDRSVASTDLALLTQRAGGNPLFVLQLVDAARHGVDLEDLPESIERLVTTRIDRLAPRDRSLLRRAAVIGRVFDADLLDLVLQLDGEPAVDAERWSTLDDLIEPEADRRWRFRHALFRDVAYEGLPFARRRRMHRAVGELLEAGVTGPPSAAHLSEHFSLARDSERTWRYSVIAGDEAWAEHAVSEAIAAYRRALVPRRRPRGIDPAQVARVSESLGDALERAARYGEAEEAYSSARRLLPTGDRLSGARLRRKLGTLAERTGRYSLALRRYRSAWTELDHEDAVQASEAARAELGYGTVRHRQGFHQELVERAHRARTRADRAGDRWLAAAAANAIQVAITHGAGPPGTGYGEEALQAFRTLGDELYVGKALNNLGIEAYFRGRWGEAADRYQAAHAAFARAGDLAEAASALQNLGEIRCDQGYWTEAETMLRQAHRDWSAAGFSIGVPLTQLNLGRTLARAGDAVAGAAALDRALDAFEVLGANSFMRDAVTWRAEVHLLLGDHEQALATLDQAGDEGEAFPVTVVRAERIRGWALLQADRHDEALVTLGRARRLCRERALSFEELLVLEGLVVAGGPSRPAEAGEWESAAARLRDQLGIHRLPRFPVPA